MDSETDEPTLLDAADLGTEVLPSEGAVDCETDEPVLRDAVGSRIEAPFGVLVELGTEASLEGVAHSGDSFVATLEVVAASGYEATCEAAAEPGMEATVEFAAVSAG